MVTEIKELKEQKQKEDGFLLTVAAGNKQSIVPHLGYEYLDTSIHEDLYKLVQYSCEEVCSTKDQLNKVMKLYASFLEPMLGVSSQLHSSEATEDVDKVRNHAINGSASSTGDSDESPGGDAVVINFRQPKSVQCEEEITLPESVSFCQTTLENGGTLAKENSSLDLDHVSRDDPVCNTLQVDKDQKNRDVSDKMSGLIKHVASIGQVGNSNASFAIGAENGPGRTNMEVTSGLYL